MKEVPSSTRPNFEDDDRLGLKPFSERLERFIISESRYLRGATVVSLNGRFGCGKTTFLAMWKNDLINRRNSEPRTKVPILLNAWENDYCGDPLVAIISALTKEGESALAASPKAREVRETIKDLGNLGLELANVAVAASLGVNLREIGSKISDARQKRTDRTLIDVFEKKSTELGKLKQLLIEWFATPETQAIIMIDELDRCRPDYAISYLETVKHLFDVKGLSFVLAVDPRQIKASSAVLFGSTLHFEDYFRKFVCRQIPFPNVPYSVMRGFYGGLFERYVAPLEEALPRTSAFNKGQVAWVAELLAGMDMTARQTEDAFRMIGHLGEISDERYHPLGGYVCAALFMCALATSNPEDFENIGRGKFDHQRVASLLSVFVENAVERIDEPAEQEVVRAKALDMAVIILAGYDQTGANPRHRDEGISSAAGVLIASEEQRAGVIQMAHQSWGRMKGQDALKLVYLRIVRLLRMAG